MNFFKKFLRSLKRFMRRILSKVTSDSAVDDTDVSSGDGNKSHSQDPSSEENETSNNGSNKDAPVLTLEQKRLLELQEKINAFDKSSGFLTGPRKSSGRSVNRSTDLFDSRAEEMMNYRQALIATENDNLAICVANRLYQQGLPPETVSMTGFLSRFAQYNWNEESDTKAENIYNKALATQLGRLQSAASPYIQFATNTPSPGDPTATPTPGMGGFMTNIPEATPTVTGTYLRPLVWPFSYIGSIEHNDSKYANLRPASEEVDEASRTLGAFMQTSNAPWLTDGLVTVDEVLAYIMGREGQAVPAVQQAIEARYLYYEGGENFQGPPAALAVNPSELEPLPNETKDEYQNRMRTQEGLVADLYLSRFSRFGSYFQPWRDASQDQIKPEVFTPALLGKAQSFLANPDDVIPGASTWDPANLALNSGASSWDMIGTVTKDGQPYQGAGKPYILDQATGKLVETVDWRNTPWHFANISDAGIPEKNIGPELRSVIDESKVGLGRDQVAGISTDSNGKTVLVFTPAQTMYWGFGGQGDGFTGFFKTSSSR